MLPAPGMLVTASVRAAGDEASKMSGENSRIHISTAARRKADDNPHNFAAIEGRYGTLIDTRTLALHRQGWNCGSGEKEKNQACYRNAQFDCLFTL
jgi:hypothetical protein